MTKNERTRSSLKILYHCLLPLLSVAKYSHLFHIAKHYSFVDPMHPPSKDLRERHKDIKAETLFLWGEDDKTFPVDLGEKMSEQFTCKYEFVRLAETLLMPHEEKPELVLDKLVPFLS